MGVTKTEILKPPPIMIWVDEAEYITFKMIENPMPRSFGFDAARPNSDLSAWVRRDETGKIIEMYTGAEADAKIAAMYKEVNDGEA